MTNLTLKQLRYVDAVSRHGHFGRAAEACAISQPALSMQVKALEEELGAPLFERAPKGVRPTALGEVFAVRAREVLRSVDELADLARAARRGLSGSLRIGVIPTVAPYVLPRVVGALAQSHPGLELTLRETITPRLIRDLDEGRIDTALLALPVSEAGLTEMALFEEEFLLVRPEAQADAPVPDREALREMRLLLLEEGHCFRDQALSFCNLRPTLPRESLDGSSLSTLVQMVGAGLGVTLIPEMAVAVETRSAPVAVTRFPAPAPSRTIGMVWRRSSPLATHLGEVGRVVAAALGGDRTPGEAEDGSRPSRSVGKP